MVRHVAAMSALHENIENDVGANIEKAQSRQNRNYDKRKCSKTPFCIGSHVLIKNAIKIRRFGSNLAPWWLGPYEVVEQLSKGRARLKNISSQKTLKNVYHGCNLKLYTATRSVQPSNHGKTSTNRKEKRCTKLSTKAKTLKERCSTKRSTKPGRPSLKKLKTLKKQKSNGKSAIGTKVTANKTVFKPPTRQMNKDLCKKLNISHVKQPGYVNSNKAMEPKTVQSIKGDGNCFFRAIAFSVSGSENQHKSVRETVVKHMTSKQTSKNLEGYLNQNVEKYLNQSKMPENGVWATDAEIMGCASLLQMDICVYSKFGNRYTWLRYPAAFTLAKKTLHALYLVNTGNDHFEVALSC